MPPTDRYVAEAQFHVRYADTDAQGIVYHGNYLVYFDEARSHYARARGSDYSLLEKEGYGLAVVDAHVRYATPARYGDIIAARTWIAELKSRMIIFAYEIANARNGQIFATGETNMMCVTRDGQVTRIPDSWMSWLKD